MDTNKLRGLGVAMITPFNLDGSVDYSRLSDLVERQIECGTDYLVICGTTAETPTLSMSERNQIARVVAEQNKGRLPIVLGVGGNNTMQVIDDIRNANLDGIDAVLSVVPFYNKPSQEGLYQHYKTIANSIDMPFLLYNVPGRTGTNMEAKTTIKLAKECKNIIAIKEASGNFRQIDEIIKISRRALKLSLVMMLLHFL
jgi:dihydrodipicolinate synthase